MSSPCGCKPGKAEEGWMERRSKACDQAELDAFAHAMKSVPKFVAKFKKEMGR